MFCIQNARSSNKERKTPNKSGLTTKMGAVIYAEFKNNNNNNKLNYVGRKKILKPLETKMVSSTVVGTQCKT